MRTLSNIRNYPHHIFLSNNRAPTVSENKNPNGCVDYYGDPIQVSTGTKIEKYVDFILPGEMGLRYVRYYIGNKWSTDFNYYLDPACYRNPVDGICRQITFYRPDGSTLVFYGEAATKKNFSSGVAKLTHNSDGTFTLHDEDGKTETFSSNGIILSVMDASGIGWTFEYSSGSLVRIVHTNGKYISIRSGMESITKNGKVEDIFVTYITAPGGSVYKHVVGSDVEKTILPGSPQTVIYYKYKYLRGAGTMLTEVGYNGRPYSYTTYNETPNAIFYGRATGTSLADGSQSTSISYRAMGWHDNLRWYDYLKAIITNPLGHKQTSIYDATRGLIKSVSDDSVATCGATVHTFEYDNNYHLTKTVDNNGVVHTYSYAANGQLQTETEAAGSPEARTTNYVWDPNERLNRLLSVTVVGLKKTVYTYTSRNRLASVAVTNLSGNGRSHQSLTTTYDYSLYSNGMVHVMSVMHPSPSDSNTDVYTYDKYGNLTSVTNGLNQTTTYGNYNAMGSPGRIIGPNGDEVDYTYDARNRVKSKTVHANDEAATWTYAYDGFGLISKVTAPNGKITEWHRNSVKQVTSITRNDKDGTSTETFSYDANGDVTKHTISRNGSVSYANTIAYDALGRKRKIIGSHGQVLTYTYDGNGNVLSVTNAMGHETNYQYDALNRVVKITESGGDSVSLPSANPTITAPESSATGTYSISWTSVSKANHYILQERANDDAWHVIQDGSKVTWQAESYTDATYHYRVRACNVTGCGSWSAIASVIVDLPPPPAQAPSLQAPSSNHTGSYSVSWTTESGASYYVLKEKIGSGSWVTRSSSKATSWQVDGYANGSYSYKVQACNVGGCGPWSQAAIVTVTHLAPPASAPTLTLPSSNTTGSYSITWTSVAHASRYVLQEKINQGSWVTKLDKNATRWSTSGQGDGSYSYRARACNDAGCGSWSATRTVTVVHPVPPRSAPGLSAPDTSATGYYKVTWGSVADAQTYALQQKIGSGSWRTRQNSSARSWSSTSQPTDTYRYRVRACNVAGCGPWSSTAKVVVTIPVPIAIDGESYRSIYPIPLRGFGNAVIGFDIVGGDTWEVFKTTPGVGNAHNVLASGAVPASATRVRYTWTLISSTGNGSDARGSLSNDATSKVAVSSNPFSKYTTETFNAHSGSHSRKYRLKVVFYNAAGANVSTSTCTLMAGTEGAL